MSLQVLYSFDHIQTADLISLPKITFISTGITATVASSGGRDGTGGLVMDGGNIGNVMVSALETPHSLVTVGAWILPETLSGNQGEFLLLGHPDAGNFLMHTSISGLVDGSLEVNKGSRNSGVKLGQTAGGVFTLGMPFYLEWQSQIGTSGFTIVKVNEVEVLHLNNVNNINATDANVKFIGFGAGLFGKYRFDDVYVVTGQDTGDGWTGFKGITKITSRLVNGIGDLNQWTPSNPSGVNWQNVDEPTPNTIDYNDAVTQGLTDLYNLEDVTFNPSAVQVDMYVRKLDAGPCSVAHVLKSGGVVYESLTPAAAGTSYKYLHKVYTRLPNGDNWTNATYNALQAGPKKVI